MSIVHIKTPDGVIITEREIISKCKTIEDCLRCDESIRLLKRNNVNEVNDDNDDNVSEICLTTISKSCMERILDYCCIIDYSEINFEFAAGSILNNLDNTELAKLLNASEFLQLDSLFNLCTMKVAQSIKGKSVAEILKLMDIPKNNQ